MEPSSPVSGLILMCVCPGQRGAAAAGGDDLRDEGGWEGSTCCSWGADMEAVFDEGSALHLYFML